MCLMSSIATRAFTFSGGPSTTSVKCILEVKTFVEYPISIAVSLLSPVRTHSLIPAFLRLAIVSGTPSWSLSSIAVAPTMCKSFSISTATAVSSLSLFSIDVDAFLCFASHFSAPSSERILTPRTNVRSPSDANSGDNQLHLSVSFCRTNMKPRSHYRTNLPPKCA